MSTKPQVTTFPKTKLLATVSVAALLFIAIPMLAHAAPNIGNACKDGDTIDSLQCGVGADASSFGSTAIGDNSTASAIDATAVGQGSR